MNVALLFVRSGQRFAHRPAVALGTEVLLSHGALVRRAAAMAGALRARFGLAPGDRAALVMRNVPEYVELLLAGWHAGLTMVPANAKLHPREIAYILEHAGARVCFVTPDLAETVAPLADEIASLQRVVEVGTRDYTELHRGEPVPPADVAPDDVAWLFYTSGTTGRPKGAMLTHHNLLAMTLAYLADVDGIAPADAILHAAPMSHGSGLYILPHAARAACQMIAPCGGFDPAEIFGLLQTRRDAGSGGGITLFAAPTMVKRLA
jgi:long-chain acyl-CoA synthetase